ncbi:MAG: hypothetical protein CMA77_01915 [Euryarchaeota archaeon]|nr:hypothetical protein [Euryarchaeota archaeon]
MGENKLYKGAPISLYRWLIEQKPDVQSMTVNKLFSTEILNISDMIDYVKDGKITPTGKNCPIIHSILWYGTIVEQLEDDSDWNPNGIYHYENTVGIITDTGVWEINLLPGAWSDDANQPAFRVDLVRGNQTYNVCIHAVSEKKLPIGDRLATLVLACWNDVETAKIVDTFAHAMGLPQPIPQPSVINCTNCGEINHVFDDELENFICECHRIYECPTCDRMQFTEHGQCPSCIANYA